MVLVDMFENEDTFVQIYERRIIQKYGRSVEKAHRFEK